MRALLDAALQSDQVAAEASQRRIKAQLTLDVLGTRFGVSTAGAFERIANDVLPVDELRGFKELAKRLMSEQAGTQGEREAAQLLYYASIASAFCLHDAQISSEPSQKRRDIYIRLARLFAGDSLGDLFETAANSSHS
jgi:hypothetical protein